MGETQCFKFETHDGLISNCNYVDEKDRRIPGLIKYYYVCDGIENFEIFVPECADRYSNNFFKKRRVPLPKKIHLRYALDDWLCETLSAFGELSIERSDCQKQVWYKEPDSLFYPHNTTIRLHIDQTSTFIKGWDKLRRAIPEKCDHELTNFFVSTVRSELQQHGSNVTIHLDNSIESFCSLGSCGLNFSYISSVLYDRYSSIKYPCGYSDLTADELLVLVCAANEIMKKESFVFRPIAIDDDDRIIVLSILKKPDKPPKRKAFL